MQLVDRIEKRRFVGREFLLFLWFESEIFEATLQTRKHGSFGLWLERSLVIRAEHELTHDLTWRLFAIVRSHATDEIIADFVGLVRAFGVYPDGIARVLLGIDRLPAFRPGGRLANYRGTPALDDDDFAEVCALAAEATRQLAAVATRHAGRLVDPTFLAGLVHALSVASLTELADEGLADAVDARL